MMGDNAMTQLDHGIGGFVPEDHIVGEGLVLLAVTDNMSPCSTKFR